MKHLIRSVRLDNGLVVEFLDRSNRYFGDYHRIYLEVCCRIPLTIELFRDSADAAGKLQDAIGLFGAEALFSRTLEKMGVAGEEVERTRAALIENFMRSTLPYLAAPAFPARFVAAETHRRRAGCRPHWPRI